MRYIDWTKDTILQNGEDSIRIVQDEEEVVKALENGETIARFEYGDSMTPIFESSEYAILKPISFNDLRVGDAVFCQVNGAWMTHMIWLINRDTQQCLIGSSGRYIYGWSDRVLALATRAKPRTFQK